MAPAESGWSNAQQNALLMSIILEMNPNLTMSGWDKIAGRISGMDRHINRNICQKQFKAIRLEYEEKFGKIGGAKRKIDAPEAPAKKKAKTKAEVKDVAEAILKVEEDDEQ
ncbi:hypothetical protein JX266_010221 [Neoarthrinium moseri]|nr:hypothetical protein JX266_010221 [Neoarthrinium moseri]